MGSYLILSIVCVVVVLFLTAEAGRASCSKQCKRSCREGMRGVRLICMSSCKKLTASCQTCSSSKKCDTCRPGYAIISGTHRCSPTVKLTSPAITQAQTPATTTATTDFGPFPVRVISDISTTSISLGFVASLNGKVFVTDYYNATTNQIMVYDATMFVFLSYISIDKANVSIQGLAASAADNCLYVSDYTNNVIYKIDLADTSTVINFTAAIAPYTLSVSSANTVVSVLGISTIQEFQADGTPSTKITISDQANQAVRLPDGTFLVVCQAIFNDTTNTFNGVRHLSSSGSILKSYGSTTKGSGPGQFHSPYGLAVDSQGYVYVADTKNNRLVLIDPTLSMSTVLSTNGQLNQPGSLWYDQSSGLLFVANFGDGNLAVYDVSSIHTASG